MTRLGAARLHEADVHEDLPLLDATLPIRLLRGHALGEGVVRGDAPRVQRGLEVRHKVWRSPDHHLRDSDLTGELGHLLSALGQIFVAGDLLKGQQGIPALADAIQEIHHTSIGLVSGELVLGKIENHPDDSPLCSRYIHPERRRGHVAARDGAASSILSR